MDGVEVAPDACQFIQPSDKLTLAPRAQRDRSFWNQQKVNREGVLQGATDNDVDSLNMLTDCIREAIKKEYIPRRDLCLELGCGGALLIYDFALIENFKRVDICDISREQMLATYAMEKEIDSRREAYMIG